MATKAPEPKKVMSTPTPTPTLTATPVSPATTPNTAVVKKEYKLYGSGNAAALAILAAGNVEKLNMPDLVLPADMQPGEVVSGIVLSVEPSFQKSIKGFLLKLKTNDGDGNEVQFLFPATGTIRKALAPTHNRVDDNDEERAALKKQLETHIGNLFIAKNTGQKLSKKYDKNMFMFDVYSVKQ